MGWTRTAAKLAGACLASATVIGVALLAIHGSPSGGQEAQPCSQWDVTGTWTVTQGNGYTFTVTFDDHPTTFDRGGLSITGTVTQPDGEWQRAGWTGPSNKFAGTVVGDRMTYQITAVHRDGFVSVGKIEGVVSDVGMDGTAIDVNAPDRGSVSWIGRGPTKCLAYEEAGTVMGEVVDVEGEATLHLAGGGSVRVTSGYKIKANDQLEIKSGRVHIRWSNGELVEMKAIGGPATGYVAPPEPTKPTTFQMIKGMFRFWFDPAKEEPKKYRFQAGSRTVITSVKGTSWSVGFDPDTQKSTVIVHEGSVEVTATAGGEPITLGPGQQVEATEQGLGAVTDEAPAGEDPTVTAEESDDSSSMPVMAILAGVVVVIGLVAFLLRRRQKPASPEPEVAMVPAMAGAPTSFTPTHTIGAEGIECRESPDPSLPVVATIDPGVPVMVVERSGDWARVVCSNEWSAWVDGRRL